jgi:hypothetical protein
VSVASNHHRRADRGAQPQRRKRPAASNHHRTTDRGAQPQRRNRVRGEQPQEPSEATAHRGCEWRSPRSRQAKRSRTNDEGDPVRALRGHESPIAFVDDTGIEPVTSSVSGKRATAAPIVQETLSPDEVSRWRRDSNPCTRLCRPLPRLSATPPLRKLARRTLSERTTGFEPATSTLARLRSTN